MSTSSRGEPDRHVAADAGRGAAAARGVLGTGAGRDGRRIDGCVLSRAPVRDVLPDARGAVQRSCRRWAAAGSDERRRRHGGEIGDAGESRLGLGDLQVHVQRPRVSTVAGGSPGATTRSGHVDDRARFAEPAR